MDEPCYTPTQLAELYCAFRRAPKLKEGSRGFQFLRADGSSHSMLGICEGPDAEDVSCGEATHAPEKHLS